jgi:hypothetical protein
LLSAIVTAAGKLKGVALIDAEAVILEEPNINQFL